MNGFASIVVSAL